jgi:Mn-dependent DtxR family transcriptional regulator
MNSRRLQVAIVQQLFELTSRYDEVSVRLLSERLGVELKVVAQALSDLHEAQLVDATRLRLTLAGLAVAVASRALCSALALAA